MKRISQHMEELKELKDYHVIKEIIQSDISYGEKVKELKGYSTPYYFELAMKCFRGVTLDY